LFEKYFLVAVLNIVSNSDFEAEDAIFTSDEVIATQR